MRHTKCELEILYRFPSKTSEILKAIKNPLKIVLSTCRLRKIYSRKSIKYWKEQREPMPLESRSVSSFIIHSAQCDLAWLKRCSTLSTSSHGRKQVLIFPIPLSSMSQRLNYRPALPRGWRRPSSYGLHQVEDLPLAW